MEKGKFMLGKFANLSGRYKYILVIIIAGMCLLVLPKTDTANEKNQGTTETVVLEDFENKVERALAECEGVGRCKVILSIQSGNEKIYEKEMRKSSRESEKGVVLEKDSDVKPSILSEGSGRESALVVKEVYPQFRGAVVICDGAEKTEVKKAVTESVMALTGLGSDKISIIKMKN